MTLYFDLETIPDLSRDALLPRDEPPPCDCEPEDIPTMKLDAAKPLIAAMPLEMLDATETAENAKDKPRKGVLEEIETCRKRLLSADETRCRTQSTTPELCRIAAFGWAVDAGPVQSVVCRSPLDEHDAITTFWRLVGAKGCGPVCGFNVAGFDLPVIFARSILLGVKPTRRFDLSPWKKDVVDLMVARAGRGGKWQGLKTLAAYYGIEVPAGDIDGSQVAAIYREDPAKLAEYVESDVEITRELHGLFEGFFC